MNYSFINDRVIMSGNLDYNDNVYDPVYARIFNDLISKYKNSLFKDNFRFKVLFQEIIDIVLIYREKYLYDWLYKIVFKYGEFFANYKNKNIGYNNFNYLYYILEVASRQMSESNDIFNIFLQKFSLSFFIIVKKQELNQYEKELIEKSWHPNRFYDWCLSIDEKIE